MIKSKAKAQIQYLLGSSIPPIVVASMGRSGSTVVYKALVSGIAAARFGTFAKHGERIVRDDAWDLGAAKLQRGVVYKTHALCQELPRPTPAKVIFMYGSPTEAAISVASCRTRYGEEWLLRHFEHLRADGPPDDIGERDVLRFNDQIKGWLGAEDIDLLGLRYETLWKHQERLCDFVGFKLTLPPQRKREKKDEVSPELASKIAQTYSALESRVAALPDFIQTRTRKPMSR